MPVFKLEDELIFPPVELSEENGLLAVGGDLSLERLLLAYTKGIFPWYSDGEPIMWWSPDPRFVIFFDKFKIPKSLKKVLNKNSFNVTIDRDFENVISQCRICHSLRGGTWITKEMRDAYINLYHHGVAHSVEVWENSKLVGGLYGVSLGKIFFGESMFSLVPNASKVALVKLVEFLKALNFLLIDSQVFTPHISIMGGQNIPRSEYLKILDKALENMEKTTIVGNWSELLRKEI
ncbi:MAG: leucyl/phenylalanyl-tRNA--protein transferase [Brevinematia bacterium]